MWSAVESIGTTALVVFIVFYFIYMIIRTLAYRRERLTMIEKMNVHPDGVVPQKIRSPYSYAWVRVASLLIGVGLGFIANYIVWEVCGGYGGDNFGDTPFGLLLSAMLLVFGGLGMFGGIMLERWLRRKDEKI